MPAARRNRVRAYVTWGDDVQGWIQVEVDAGDWDRQPTPEAKAALVCAKMEAARMMVEERHARR